jgi:hypothetical protein
MQFDIKLGKSYATFPRTPVGEIISEINHRIQRPSYVPSVGITGLGVSCCLGLIFPWSVAATVLLVNLLVTLGIYWKEKGDRVTVLHYEFDHDINNYFSTVQRACRNLAGSEKIWLEDRRQLIQDHQKSKGASHSVSFSQTLVRIKRLAPPHVQINLDIWGIDVGQLKLFFLPDYVLVFRKGLYSAASYSSFDIHYEPEIINIRGGRIPSDAQVNQQTNLETGAASGSRVTQVQYGLLKIVSSVGFCLRLHVSNSLLAEKFIENFRNAQGILSRRRQEQARTMHGRNGHPMESGGHRSAYEVLGVKPNASLEEIKQAYHQAARLNHPDLVAGLAPEFQELATRRIREINAAYRELRQKVHR